MDLNRGLPGETPIDDVSGLKLKYITTVGQLYDAEFLNIAKAVAKYLARKPTRRMAPFTTKWMLRVHREMLGDIWTWAGTVRTGDLNIGVPAHSISVEMETLAGDIDYWKPRGGDAIEQAASIHHSSVRVHPFLNGNGRWARLLSQIWQYQRTSVYTAWPEQDMWRGASSIRPQYIAALAEADKGDLQPLINLHLLYTPSSS